MFNIMYIGAVLKIFNITCKKCNKVQYSEEIRQNEKYKSMENKLLFVHSYIKSKLKKTTTCIYCNEPFCNTLIKTKVSKSTGSVSLVDKNTDCVISSDEIIKKIDNISLDDYLLINVDKQSIYEPIEKPLIGRCFIEIGPDGKIYIGDPTVAEIRPGNHFVEVFINEENKPDYMCSFNTKH